MADDPRNQLGDISLGGKSYAIMVDTYIQESQPAVYEKYNTGIAQLTDLSILQHVGDHSPFMVTGHHIFAPQTLLDSQGFSLGNNGLTVIKIPLSVASGAYAAMLSGAIVGTNKPVFMFGGRELVWNGSAWTDGDITVTFGFDETQVVYAPPYIYLLKNGKIYYDIPLLDTVSAIKYIGNKLVLPDGSEISIPTNITSLDLVKTNGTGEIIQGRDFQIEGETGKIKFLENSYAVNGAPYTVSYLYQQLADATKQFSLANSGGVPVSYDLTYDNISSALIYNGVLEDILIPGRDYAIEGNSFSAKLLQPGRYRPGNFAVTYLAMVPYRTTTTKEVLLKKIALDQKRILSCIAYDPSFTQNDLNQNAYTPDYEIDYAQGKIRFTRNSLATIGKSYLVDYTNVTHPTAIETPTPASTITLANKRIVEFSIGRQTKQVFFPVGSAGGRDFEIDKASGKIRLGKEIRSSMCTTFDLTFKKSVTELARTKVSIGTGNMEVFEDPIGGKKVLSVPTIHRVLKPYDDGLLWVPFTQFAYEPIAGIFTFHCRKEDIGTRIWLRGQKYGYTPLLTSCAWDASFQVIGSNLSKESINVYAYSTGGTPKQYQVGISYPGIIDSPTAVQTSKRTTSNIISLDKYGRPNEDIIIDIKNKTYLIPSGSALPSSGTLVLTYKYLNAPTTSAPTGEKKTLLGLVTTGQWVNLATMDYYINPETISLIGKLTDGRPVDKYMFSGSFDKKTNNYFCTLNGLTLASLDIHFLKQKIESTSSNITNTSTRNEWIDIPHSPSFSEGSEIIPDSITATMQANYIYKYAEGYDWNYDFQSGIIFFNRLANSGSGLQKLIETVTQSWESKNFTTLPGGGNLLLRESFPSDPSDYPIYTYDWGVLGGGSYTDYWAYQNWKSHLVMQQVMNDFDDRPSEQISPLTPRWYNIAAGTIRVDETVDLRKQTDGQEIYVSYIRGTVTDVTETGLTITDGWIDLTGITDYKDIDLDTLSIELDGFWAYKENFDYLLNREAGILTAFEGSGIACAANTDPLKAYYNYELYTPVTAEPVTAVYDWTSLVNKSIVPRSERVYFTIDETYKGRKLYFKEGVDYTIDIDSGTLYVLDGGRILGTSSVGLEIVNYELETKTIASQAMDYNFSLLVGDSEYWKPIPGSEIISTTPPHLMLMEENMDYVIDRGTGWIKRIENGRILTTDNLTARLTYFNIINHSQSINASYTWQNLTYPKIATQAARVQYTPGVSGHPNYSFVFQKDVDYSVEPESGVITATPFNRFTTTDVLSMTHQYLDLQAKLTQLIADGQVFSPVDSGIACEKLTVGAQILGINDGKVFNLQGKTAIELINFGGTTVNGIAYFYGQALAFGHTNIDNRNVGFIASLAGEKLVTLDQELTTDSSVTAVAESGHLYFAAGTCIYEYMGNNEYKKLYDHGVAIDSMRFINNKLYYSSGGSIYLFEGGTNYAEASFITGALNAGFRNVNKLFRKVTLEFDSHPTGTLTVQAFENYKRLKDSFAESFVEHSAYDIPVTWDGNNLTATVPDKLTGADLYLRLKYTRPAGETGSEFSVKSYDVEFIPLNELKLDWRVTIRAQMGVKFRDMKVETRTPKEILDQLNTLKEGNIPIAFRSLHGEDYSVLIDKITTEGMAINAKQGESLITLTLFQV